MINNIKIGFFFFTALLSVIAPFFSLMLVSFLSLVSNGSSIILGRLIFLSFIIWSVFLQTKRIWLLESPTDWEVGYRDFFENQEIDNIFDVFTYNEPVWLLLNLFSRDFIGLTAYGFLNLIACITLTLLCCLIYQHWKSLNLGPSRLLVSLSIILFSTEFLALLNNTLRIAFAFSIAMIGSVKYAHNSKNPIFFFFLGGFIHNSVFILFLFYFFGLTRRHISIKIIKYFAVSFSFLVIGYLLIPSFIPLIGDNFIHYIMYRIISATNPNDQVVMSSIVILINLLFWGGLSLSAGNSKNFVYPINYFSLLLIFLLSFAFLLVFFMPEIAGRLFILKILVIPFVVPYIMFHSKTAEYIVGTGVFCYLLAAFVLKFDQNLGGILFPKFVQIITMSVFSLTG